MMVPDLGKTAPLGLRNKLDISIQHPFLVCESLIENIQTKIHPGSKKWSPTEIADTTEIELNEKKLENETLMLDYLNAISFRIKHNIGDWADRNFIVYKERFDVGKTKARPGGLASAEERYTTLNVIARKSDKR